MTSRPVLGRFPNFGGVESDHEPDVGVEAAWAAEIERRAADLESGKVQGIPWEQVRQRLLDKLNAR